MRKTKGFLRILFFELPGRLLHLILWLMLRYIYRYKGELHKKALAAYLRQIVSLDHLHRKSVDDQVALFKKICDQSERYRVVKFTRGLVAGYMKYNWVSAVWSLFVLAFIASQATDIFTHLTKGII